MARDWLCRYRQIMVVVLVLMLLAGTLPGQPTKAKQGQLRFRPGELVVSINPTAGLTIEALAAELGATVRAQLAPDRLIYLLLLPAGSDPAVVAERLDLDPRLLFAEPNYLTGAPEADPRGIGGWGGTDPTPLPIQPALAQIRLADALRLSQGAGVVIAVIDTGAQLAHPDLAASLAPGGYDFIDGDSIPEDVRDGVDDDRDGMADEAFGHGTHVAGIAHLVAPAAHILVLRALTAEGDGDAFTVGQAIDYASRQGASVINLSLGTPDSATVLREAVQAAAQSGALVVAAAGNEASKEKQFPAAANCAIAVTSVGTDDRHSDFANLGGWISVAAPGESIFSAFPDNGYAWWSGTSMATPFVAGQAALLGALRPDMNVRQLADLIGGTAADLTQANPTLKGQLGDGRIDLAASLLAASAGTPVNAEHSRFGDSCVAAGTR